GQPHGSAAISTERPTRHLGPQSSGGAYRVSPISSKEPAWQSCSRKLVGNCKLRRMVTLEWRRHYTLADGHVCRTVELPTPCPHQATLSANLVASGIGCRHA